jgi:hypothetical protein
MKHPMWHLKTFHLPTKHPLSSELKTHSSNSFLSTPVFLYIRIKKTLLVANFKVWGIKSKRRNFMRRHESSSTPMWHKYLVLSDQISLKTSEFKLVRRRLLLDNSIWCCPYRDLCSSKRERSVLLAGSLVQQLPGSATHPTSAGPAISCTLAASTPHLPSPPMLVALASSLPWNSIRALPRNLPRRLECGLWTVECAVLARCSTYGLYGQRCVMTYSRVLFSFQVWLGRGVSRRARPGKSSPPIFWWEHLGTTLLNNNFFFYKMRNITKLICKQTYSPPWLPKAEGTLYIWYKNRYLSSIAYQSSMSKILLK